MPYKDPEKQRAFGRIWMQNHRAQRTAYRHQLRSKVLVLLGNKCVYCECDNPDALEINHKNGGGGKDKNYRGKNRMSFYLDLLSGRRTKDDFELTCKICNAWHYLVKLKGLPDNWEIRWIPR